MRLFYLQELEVERALEQKRLTDFQGWLSEVRQKRQVTSLKTDPIILNLNKGKFHYSDHPWGP